MAASWASSSIMWWSPTMRAPGLRLCVLSLISGSRLHHWLPTSRKVPMLSCCGTQFLASTPPRVAPSLWLWSSVACSAVQCIRLPGGYEARQGDVLRKHFTLRVVI
jgi:hypothetical protein